MATKKIDLGKTHFQETQHQLISQRAESQLQEHSIGDGEISKPISVLPAQPINNYNVQINTQYRGMAAQV